MEIGRLAAILAVILNHAPKAIVTIKRPNPGVLTVTYNMGKQTLNLDEWEVSIVEDHRVGLYDGYAEIML